MPRICLVSENKHDDTPLGVLDVAAYCLSQIDSLRADDFKFIGHKFVESGEEAKLVLSTSPEVIGISCFMWNVGYVCSLLSDFRREGFNGKIVLGGPNADALPNAAVELADHVVIGDGEIAFAALLAGLKGGKIIDCRRDQWDSRSLGSSPYLLGLVSNDYREYYLEAARGCARACAFCTEPQRRTATLLLPMARVEAEIDWLCSIPRQIRIVDNSLNQDESRFASIVRRFLDHAVYQSLRFSVNAETINREQIALINSDSRIHVEIGLQSGSEASQLHIGKRLDLSKFYAQLSEFRFPRNICVDLIVGLPGETVHSFLSTLTRLMEIGVSISLEKLKVMPGTPMWKNSAKWGVEFSQDGLHFVEHTRELSSRDIENLNAIAATLIGRAPGALNHTSKRDDLAAPR